MNTLPRYGKLESELSLPDVSTDEDFFVELFKSHYDLIRDNSNEDSFNWSDIVSLYPQVKTLTHDQLTSIARAVTDSTTRYDYSDKFIQELFEQSALLTYIVKEPGLYGEFMSEKKTLIIDQDPFDNVWSGHLTNGNIINFVQDADELSFNAHGGVHVTFERVKGLGTSASNGTFVNYGYLDNVTKWNAIGSHARGGVFLNFNSARRFGLLANGGIFINFGRTYAGYSNTPALIIDYEHRKTSQANYFSIQSSKTRNKLGDAYSKFKSELDDLKQYGLDVGSQFKGEDRVQRAYEYDWIQYKKELDERVKIITEMIL